MSHTSKFLVFLSYQQEHYIESNQNFWHILKFDTKIEDLNIWKTFMINTQNVIEIKYNSETTINTIYLKMMFLF